MRAVCHIGTPKTATSYLQETLAANTRWLAKQGILYPDMKSDSNHITLHLMSHEGLDVFSRSYGLTSKADVVQLRHALKEHLSRQVAKAKSNIHTVVLSSENLTGNTPRQGLPILHDFLASIFDEVEIIVYVRRQDEAILSMYAEHMRMGFSNQNLDEFIKKALTPGSGLPYLSVGKMLHDWRTEFGPKQVTTRLFDRDHMQGGDVLADFLTCVLGKPPADLDRMKRSTFKRDSLSAPALEFLRMTRSMIPFGIDGKENPVRRALTDRIDTLPRSPRPQMSYAQSLQIMAHFITANTWLQKYIFPDLDLSYFGPNPALPATSNLGQITPAEFSQFSDTLFKP